MKLLIQQANGIQAAEQRLLFDGQPLEDDSRTLQGCGIGDGSTLHLSVLLCDRWGAVGWSLGRGVGSEQTCTPTREWRAVKQEDARDERPANNLILSPRC